jgi:serine O-acetyltransferase
MPQPHLVLCQEYGRDGIADAAWRSICLDAAVAVQRDRLLSGLMGEAVLRHGCFAEALLRRLARKLETPEVDATALTALFAELLAAEAAIVPGAIADLAAIRDRDPACPDLLTPFLHFKGFLALQTWRLSHVLWAGGRTHLALHLQSRMSQAFAIDIHPAARLGRGILLDHGTGIVIGETAVVEDDVSILQEVTLGGTGKECGDRHPKIRRGVLIGAGAKILGNIEVGEGAKVGAGSIVLEAVEPFTTVVGVPARPVGPRHTNMPALTMDHSLLEPDYAI